MSDPRQVLRDTGRVWIRIALDERALTAIENALPLDDRPGARFRDPAVLATNFGVESSVGGLIADIWQGYFPTRAVGFDKSADQNWAVRWHQDQVIAVKKRQGHAGFGAWSTKDGVPHCCPPQSVLDDMLFVRLHLDDVTADAGPIDIAVGSHLHGIVRKEDIPNVVEQSPIEPCLATRGDILVLNMLMLHRSEPSQTVSRRRAIRIDYARVPLPLPLEWNI